MREHGGGGSLASACTSASTCISTGTPSNMLRKGATWFLGLQEDLAARENGLQDAAGVPPVDSGSVTQII